MSPARTQVALDFGPGSVPNSRNSAKTISSKTTASPCTRQGGAAHRTTTRRKAARTAKASPTAQPGRNRNPLAAPRYRQCSPPDAAAIVTAGTLAPRIPLRSRPNPYPAQPKGGHQAQACETATSQSVRTSTARLRIWRRSIPRKQKQHGMGGQLFEGSGVASGTGVRPRREARPASSARTARAGKKDRRRENPPAKNPV